MRCLPTAWPPVCVGSYTETTTVFVPPLSCGVMSYANESYPPLWAPTWVPLTQTVVCQSDAPKLSSTRRPFQFDGTVKVRLYQSLSFSVIFRWMPESADSATKGTRI